MWNFRNHSSAFRFGSLECKEQTFSKELFSLLHTGYLAITFVLTSDPSVVWVLSKKGTFIMLKYNSLCQLRKDKNPYTQGKILVIFLIKVKGNFCYGKGHRVKCMKTNSDFKISLSITDPCFILKFWHSLFIIHKLKSIKTKVLWGQTELLLFSSTILVHLYHYFCNDENQKVTIILSLNV